MPTWEDVGNAVAWPYQQARNAFFPPGPPEGLMPADFVQTPQGQPGNAQAPVSPLQAPPAASRGSQGGFLGLSGPQWLQLIGTLGSPLRVGSREAIRQGGGFHPLAALDILGQFQSQNQEQAQAKQQRDAWLAKVNQATESLPDPQRSLIRAQAATGRLDVGEALKAVQNPVITQFLQGGNPQGQTGQTLPPFQGQGESVAASVPQGAEAALGFGPTPGTGVGPALPPFHQTMAQRVAQEPPERQAMLLADPRIQSVIKNEGTTATAEEMDQAAGEKRKAAEEKRRTVEDKRAEAQQKQTAVQQVNGLLDQAKSVADPAQRAELVAQAQDLMTEHGIKDATAMGRVRALTPAEGKNQGEEQLTDTALHDPDPANRRRASENLNAMQARKLDIARTQGSATEMARQEADVTIAKRVIKESSLVQNLLDGKITPGEISQSFRQPYVTILATGEAMKRDPTYNWVEADANKQWYQAQGTQRLIRRTESIVAPGGAADESIRFAKLVDNPAGTPINALTGRAKVMFGNSQRQLLNLVNDVSAEEQQQIFGAMGGGERFLDLAKGMTDTNLSVEQYVNAVKEIKYLIYTRQVANVRGTPAQQRWEKMGEQFKAQRPFSGGPGNTPPPVVVDWSK